MTRSIRVADLRPGDVLELARHCEPVIVEELVHEEGGKVRVRWWRPTGEGHKRRRRYLWTHPRGADGKPRRTRYSLGALRAINEAIDGRELGSLISLEPEELVRLVARKEET